MKPVILTIVVGIGATAITDLWTIVRKLLFGINAPNFGLVGRWIGHMPSGRFQHDSIAASPPLRGEGFIGWTAHYLIGVAFAALLVLVVGPGWLDRPSFIPALIFGIVTVLAPWLLMQPGMGLGIAGSRTPNPAAVRVQSLVTHIVFGIGLYVSAVAVRQVLA